MSSPQKPGTPPVNMGIMRLELLMRAHEISRRINERVRHALQAKSTAATPASVAESAFRATTENVSETPQP